MIHHQPIINLSILLIITGIATIMSDLLHHIEDDVTAARGCAAKLKNKQTDKNS